MPNVGGWDGYVPSSISATCGWCRTAVEMPAVSKSLEIKKMQDRHDARAIAAMYACPRDECGMPSLVSFALIMRHREVERVERLEIIPRGQAQPMPDLPADEVAADRREAWSCYFGGDLRASVIMARAAVQRAVRKLNATGSDLKAEIDSLRSSGVITEELKEWAHEVRLAGNDAAHPDTMGEITADHATESLDFMEEFLRHTIAMPARRAKRAATRQSTS